MRNRTVFAIALMCSATIIFSALDATAKYLGSISEVPVSQIIWIRFLCHIMFTMIILGPLTLPSLVKTKKIGHQILRSLFMLGATAFNFFALKYLQLDQTITIFFLCPLIVAALAGPLLNEWVGLQRLIAIIIGFIGIIIVMQPGFGGVHPAAILSFIAAFSYSLYNISTRYLAPYDKTETTQFYSPLAGALLFAPFALLDWQWPENYITWLLLLSLGITGGLSHWLLIIAHKYAPAPILAPFVYIGLLSMTVIGYLVFGDIPTVWTLAGGMIIILSGLYLLYREHRQKHVSESYSLEKV